MAVSDFLAHARDSFAARTVYAEPIEKDGVTIVPAAMVMGGGGLGTLRGDEGGGFGMMARPVGAFVIKDGEVRWRPAVDATKLIAALLVTVVLVLRKRR